MSKTRRVTISFPTANSKALSAKLLDISLIHLTRSNWPRGSVGNRSIYHRLRSIYRKWTIVGRRSTDGLRPILTWRYYRHFLDVSRGKKKGTYLFVQHIQSKSMYSTWVIFRQVSQIKFCAIVNGYYYNNDNYFYFNLQVITIHNNFTMVN